LEDDILRTAIASLHNATVGHNSNFWKSVSMRITHRTSRECHDRWFNWLAPLPEWTNADDRTLLLLIAQHCPLEVIYRLLPSYSNLAVENRIRFFMYLAARDTSAPARADLQSGGAPAAVPLRTVFDSLASLFPEGASLYPLP
jgi:hypothetical protein